jgi:hypothetical protein
VVPAAFALSSICASTLLKNDVSIFPTSVNSAAARLEIVVFHKTKIPTVQEMIVQLARRAHCNPDKSCQFTAGRRPQPSVKFDPIDTARPSQLTYNSVDFFSPKYTRRSIQLQRQSMGLAPNLQVPIIPHDHLQRGGQLAG